MLFSIPQILLVGPTIQFIGFIPALLFIAIVATVGAWMVNRGLSCPMPILDERRKDEPELEEEDIEIVAEDVEE
jgi:hypothetical protein